MYRIEALQCMLGWNLRVLRGERRIRDRRDDELVTQPLRILEREPAAVARRARRGESCLPEVERRLGADAPLDGVNHPGACTTALNTRVLEERDVASRCSVLVRVEEVVDGRVVLIDRLLHHPQAENARVEVDVARRIARDAGHVMDAVERQLFQTLT